MYLSGFPRKLQQAPSKKKLSVASLNYHFVVVVLASEERHTLQISPRK